MLNKIYDTNPLVAHAPGDFDYSFHWGKILNNLTQSEFKTCAPINDLTIVTWNSIAPQANKKLGVFENSLLKLNYKFDVLRNEGIWNTNRIKIVLLNKFLKLVNTEYILGADSSDVIVLHPLDSIIPKFIKHDCDILFNAEKRFWPYDEMHHIKKFEDSVGVGIFKYLNAGLWIAKTKGCINFFKKCEEYLNLKIHPYSEQVCVKHAYKDLYPSVKIDYNCSIFQNLNLVRNDELEVI